jgi:hypothetical protein
MSRAYDSAEYQIPRVDTLGVGITMNIAAASRARWVPPTGRDGGTGTFVVKEVIAIVMTAGTTSGAAFTVKKGTTSIGSVAVSTSTAGSRVVASLTDTEFTSTDIMSIENSVSEATGVFTLEVDYQEKFVA